MLSSSRKKSLLVLAAFVALWLGMRFVLPLMLPFFLGGALALAAEPLVELSVRKMRFPRWLGAGVGVLAALCGVVTIVWIVGAVAVKELGSLTRNMPNIGETASQGMLMAQDFFVNLSEKAPESIRPMLQKTVLDVFDGGEGLIKQATGKIPAVLGAAVGRVGNGALGVGVGVLAAFLISARLPALRQMLATRIPAKWREEYLPALRRVRTALGGWLKAQLMLCAVTYGIVAIGFLILDIDYGWLWAALVAVVDAVPVLGTGTVLVPWALVLFFQDRTLQAVGLLCTYAAALITRTVLEPRLVGKQLGLDPLITLLALYIGYRFWGILGMLVTPILASAAKSLVSTE